MGATLSFTDVYDISTKKDDTKSNNKSTHTSTWSRFSHHSSTLRKDDELVVKIMMPLYFNDEPLRFQDVYDAKLSWDKIVQDISPEYEVKRSKLPYASCREWFESIFYERLFDVHPFSKKMFKDVSTQGKFLVSLFSFIFTVMDDDEKFVSRLTNLAESHCKRGVKSSEYAIIGEVMFWTLKTCLGCAYDSKTQNAWVKMFSKMLKVIVPISVGHELRNNEAQLDRLQKFNDSVTPTNRGDNPMTSCPLKFEDIPTKSTHKTNITIKDSIMSGLTNRQLKVKPSKSTAASNMSSMVNSPNQGHSSGVLPKVVG